MCNSSKFCSNQFSTRATTNSSYWATTVKSSWKRVIHLTLTSDENAVITNGHLSRTARQRTRPIIQLTIWNKKAQLSLTNPRDAKVCQKLLQFDVLTTLSLTILPYLHSFSCCCVRNLRNPEKFTENSNLWSSKSSKVIDLGANRKLICDFILVINSNFSRICYRSRDIHG